MLFVDCPSLAFVQTFTTDKQWMEYNSASSQHRVSVIVHMCPMSVLSDTRYLEWSRSFGVDAQVVSS